MKGLFLSRFSFSHSIGADLISFPNTDLVFKKFQHQFIILCIPLGQQSYKIRVYTTEILEIVFSTYSSKIVQAHQVLFLALYGISLYEQFSCFITVIFI